jgi:hypothetical protein
MFYCFVIQLLFLVFTIYQTFYIQLALLKFSNEHRNITDSRATKRLL